MNLSAQKQSTTARPPLTPHTSTGWIAVALGFASPIVGHLLVFVLQNGVTDGFTTATPGWMPIVAPVCVVALSLVGVLAGLRTSRIDRSTLGTMALSFAAVIGAWSLFTGVLHLFFIE